MRKSLYLAKWIALGIGGSLFVLLLFFTVKSVAPNRKAIDKSTEHESAVLDTTKNEYDARLRLAEEWLGLRQGAEWRYNFEAMEDLQRGSVRKFQATVRVEKIQKYDDYPIFHLSASDEILGLHPFFKENERKAIIALDADDWVVGLDPSEWLYDDAKSASNAWPRRSFLFRITENANLVHLSRSPSTNKDYAAKWRELFGEFSSTTKQFLDAETSFGVLALGLPTSFWYNDATAEIITKHDFLNAPADGVADRVLAELSGMRGQYGYNFSYFNSGKGLYGYQLYSGPMAELMLGGSESAELISRLIGTSQLVSDNTVEEPSAPRENGNIDFSDDKQNKINTFFSNFAEVNLASFENRVLPNEERIRFGVMHCLINRPSIQEKLNDMEGRIPAQEIEASVKKYFGLNIETHHSLPAPYNWIVYRNGFYYFPYADGEIRNHAKVTSFEEIAPNRYRARGTIHPNEPLERSSTGTEWLPGSFNAIVEFLPHLDRYILISYHSQPPSFADYEDDMVNIQAEKHTPAEDYQATSQADEPVAEMQSNTSSKKSNELDEASRFFNAFGQMVGEVKGRQ